MIKSENIEEIETEYVPTTYREPKVDDALFAKGYARLPSVLKRLGFEKLRAGQDEAIYSVLAGVDSICIMPTAGGKSLIFIAPALCQGWKTIVFSPLKALMRDQVKKLQAWGVAAFAVSSDSSPAENDYALQQWVEGECEILYIAPERLMNDTFKQVLRQRPPDAIVVDECFPGNTYVHCEHGNRSMQDLWHSYSSGHPLPRVLSTDEKNNLVWRQITRVMKRDPKPLVRVHIATKGSLECTSDHIWFTERGECKAGDLTLDSLVVSVDEGFAGGCLEERTHFEEVLMVESLEGDTPRDLYDIEVEETHKFFVRLRSQIHEDVSGTSVLVHNCHVISAWNDNFRHAYTYIGDAIERYQPRVVLAVTATFNKRIEEDVRRVLGTPKAKKIVSYTPRMNLHLSSSEMRSQQDVLDKVREIDGKILIYCGWKKNCEKYAQYLSRELAEEVGVYHSQVTGTVKKSCQDRFARKNDLRIVCATNAFGMGVDIPDIDAVIHIVYPGDPEALDQECGRGGRAGQDCICHTFQSRGAHDFQMKLLESGHPTRPLFERVFDVMKRKADTDGVFHMDAMEIQALSNVEIDYQTAIIQTLQGAKVIETIKGVAKTYRIKILKEPDWEGEKLNATQIHYARMTEFIRKEFSLSNGAYDFDIDILAQMLGLAPSTMATHLRSWHAEGLVQYDPPPRTTPKRVIGDLSLVQFDRLRIKRSEAFGKLDYVEAYFNQPDDKKREYLRDYFLATAGD